MDPRTGNLVRLLQAGPFDEHTLRGVRAALWSLRGHRDLEQERDDLVILLDDFAESATTPAASAGAYLLAAELCAQAGMAEERIERLSLAMDADPKDLETARCLRSALGDPQARPRLLALLSVRARALEADEGASADLVADAFVQLAAELEKGGALGDAIKAYDQALEVQPSLETVEALASLHTRRRAPGDAEQAADLYCMLADLLPEDSACERLRRAVTLVPGHPDATARLAGLTAAAGSGRASTMAGQPAGVALPPGDAGPTVPGHPAAAVIAPAAPDAGEAGQSSFAAAETQQSAHAMGNLRPPGASLEPAHNLPPSASWAAPPRSSRAWRIGGIVLAATAVAAVGYAAVAPGSEPGTEVASAAAALDHGAEGMETTIKDSPGPLNMAGHPEANAHPGAAAGEPGRPDSGPLQAPAPNQDEAEAEPEPATPTVALAEPEPRARTKPAVEIVGRAARVRGAKLPVDQVLGAMERSMPKLERCYARALRGAPKLEGRLVYRLQVRKTGRARSVKKIAGTIRNRKLVACARKVLARTRFPRLRRGRVARVRLPLRFRTNG